MPIKVYPPVVLKPFCPQCGRATDLFDLKPDPTRTVASVACPECSKTERRGVVSPTVCSACDSPSYTNWKFCFVCGKERVLPS